MLCCNIRCQNCINDECTSIIQNGIVPYEFVGDIMNSVKNCKQFKESKGFKFIDISDEEKDKYGYSIASELNEEGLLEPIKPTEHEYIPEYSNFEGYYEGENTLGKNIFENWKVEEGCEPLSGSGETYINNQLSIKPSEDYNVSFNVGVKNTSYIFSISPNKIIINGKEYIEKIKLLEKIKRFFRKEK